MADQSSTDLNEFLGAKEQSPLRKYLKWGAVAIGVILLILLVKHFAGGGEKTGYATQKVETGDLTVSVSATGKLAPTNQVTVGSQLSGLVSKVVVDVNDRVVAGQPLALIDPEQIDDQIRAAQAQLAANQAAVNQAQATVEQTRATLARYQEVSKLSGGRVPAKTELEGAVADRDRAIAALKTAQANVAAAQATLAQNQTQRQRAVIKSPVTGVVLARQIDPGQTVASSFNTPTLFVIAQDLSQMKLEVAVDEADVGQIKQGQRATFTVDAFPGKTFPATVTRVDLGSNLTVQDASSSSSTTSSSATSATSGQVVSYAADLSVANPTLELRPGMTATADIVTTEDRNVLLVPNAALRFKPQAAGAGDDSGGIASSLVMRRPGRDRPARTATVSRGATQTVYVKGADGKPQRISITTGDTDGTMTQVLGGGLKPGMEVITGQLASGDSSSSSGGSRRGSGRRSGGGASRGGGGGGGGQ